MKNIIENFDQAAAHYESLAQPQAALAENLAQWILPAERKGRALELGAGTGLFTRRMLPWNGIYTATDAAPKMVAVGRAHCPTADWKVLDAREPPGVESMDWLFACSLLQWMPEPQKVLQRWRKILKPDGQLAVAVLLPGTLGELQSVLPQIKPLDWHSAAEWRMLVENAGFCLEREQSGEQQSLHPNSLELMRAVHGMGLAPRQMVGPGRLRTALREYNQRHAIPGGVRTTWRAWLARAKAS
jgi:ubiquinone/menaquinone biosynthesis C-methylase UbiE